MPHRLLIILGFFLPVFSFGQTYFVTAYQPDDGLPTHVVRQTVQDSLGYIWVATDKGLSRFDGKHFQNFEGLLKSQYIKGFSKDKEGRIHFINDTGLYALEYQDGQPTVKEELTEGLDFPNGIFHDGQNRGWLSQPNGRVALFAAGKTTYFDLGKTEMTGTSDARFSFAEDRHGNIFLASPMGGLFYFDETQRKFILKKRLDRLNDLEADGDSLWAAGASLHYFKCEKGGKLVQQRTTQTDDFQISCFKKNKAGEWFAGTDCEGIFRLENEKGRFSWQKIFGSNDPHRVEELPFETIHNLDFVPTISSPEGQMWVSSREGLGLLHSRFFDHIAELSNDNVLSISPAEKGLNVTFGTVTQISKNKDGFSVFGRPEMGRVTSLASTENGFWAGQPNGELFYFDGKKTLFRHDLSERGGELFHLMLDRKGSLWFGQAPTGQPLEGVGRRLSSGELVFYGEEHQLGSRIWVVVESPRGEIYLAGIGEDTYLYRFHPQEGFFENISLPLPFRPSKNFEVHDMAIDGRDMIYLATTDGLLRYDSEHIIRLDIGELTEVEFRGVTTLPDGEIWAATNIHGLVYSDENGPIRLGENSGLPTTISTYRCLSTDTEGRLWAGTAEGLVYSVSKNPVLPQTVKPIFSEIIFGYKKITSAFHENSNHKEDRDLKFKFNSLAYPGDNILYQHRLKNISGSLLDEKGWSEPTTENILLLKNMQAGKYELSIRAQQPGGFTWSEPLVYSFKLTRVWYKTWWAKTLFILLGLFIFWTYIRIHFLRLIKRIRLLEISLARKSHELERKEALLQEQTKELVEQKEELAETNTNIEIIHQCMQQISEKSTWEEVVKIMAKAMEVSHIDAFEFAALHNHKLIYSGFSEKEMIYTKREQEFDDRTSLTAWALSRGETILINDFRKEHHKFVTEKRAYFYQSMILLPFRMKDGKRAALSIYCEEKDAFSEWEMKMLDILTIYLAHTVEGHFYIEA